MPAEKTVRLRFDASGVPGSFAAGTAVFDAQAEALRAASAATQDDAAAARDAAKAEYLLAMAERMRANTARDAAAATGGFTAAQEESAVAAARSAEVDQRQVDILRNLTAAQAAVAAAEQALSEATDEVTAGQITMLAVSREVSAEVLQDAIQFGIAGEAARKYADDEAAAAAAAALLRAAQSRQSATTADVTASTFDQTAATLASVDATLTGARAAATYDAAMKVLNGEFKDNAKAADAATASAGRGWGIWRLLTRDITLFGGALGTLPFLGTVTGLHLITDAAVEVAAVVIPATIAFGAFGAAAVPTLRDIYHQMQAVYTTSTALGQNIYPMTGGFQAMADAVRPEVYQLFGQALVVMNSRTGAFTTLAREAGSALDQLGARAAVALTSGGMSQFLAQGPADLAKIGDIIGNIFGAVGNALRVMPGYAETLLQVFDDLSHALETVTGSGIGQWVLGAGEAFHGAVLWIGLGATAAVTLGNALTGLAARFGLATEGALAFNAAQFGIGIRQMLAGVQLLAAELLAASSAEDVAAAASLSLRGAMSALAAVNPLVWIGGAITGLALLADHVIHAANATDDYVASTQKALGAVPVSQLALDLTLQQVKNTSDLRAAQADLNASTGRLNASQMLSAVLAGTLSDTQRRLWGNYADTAALAKQLTTDQANYNTVLAAAHGNVGLLNDAGITSDQILNANKEQLKQLVIEAQAAAAAQQALALGTGRAAAALNAQTNSFMTETVPALQKVTQAEDALLSVITGGEQSFVSFQQSIQGTSAKFTQPSGLGPSAKLAGASLSGLNEQSLYLANTFYGIAIPALQKLSDSLQQQHISTGDLTKVIATGAAEMLRYTKGNTEANAVITSLINNALGPGTVSLQNLNTWVKNNSTSLQGMNAIIAQSTIQAGTLANVLETQLNAQFHQALLQYSGADAALNAYTNALTHNQASTASGQAIRQQLISDLTHAGFSAAQAASYVNGLSAAINSMPSSKTVTITTIEQTIGAVPAGVGAPGVTAPHHAAGWRVPGYGGGDTVPAWLEPGEAVVPKHLVPAVAPFLSAHHVPGFAAGTVIGHGGGHSGTQWNMSDVAALWARELWAGDLRGHGRGHPLGLAAMEAVLHAVTQPKNLTGLWANPLYRMLQRDVRHDIGPYGAEDLKYWALLGDEAALRRAEKTAIARDLHQIRLHEQHHQPGWVRYYERQMAALEHADAAKMAGFAAQLAHLTRLGFSSGGLVRSYDAGGYLPVGLSMAYNGTGRPEPVGAASGKPEVHVHLHGDLAAGELWDRMQVKTLDYGYLNSGRPTGIWQPGG